MSTWALDENGNYINLDRCIRVLVVETGPKRFYLMAMIEMGNSSILSGTWKTEEEAREAARVLLQGINPQNIRTEGVL